MKNIILFFIAFMTAIASSAEAQNRNLVSGESSWMKISGTSTIHDWECEVQEVNGSLALDPAAEVPVTSLSFAVPVTSIESGKGAMNRKIYDALKRGDHPQIRFTLTDAAQTGGSGNTVTMDVTGDLQIAGVTRSVTLQVSGQQNANGWLFEGSYTMNMNDFEVSPPTAMLGTIRSGEEVTITFNLRVSNG
ncbi:MAG: YceI family protein [Balneolaceae bacterium]|nr:YceI family protein [Balneolaceae bacterium]